MSEKIRHQGTVERVVGDCVTVRIAQTSACAACRLNGHCNASESQEKLIDAHVDNGSAPKVGDVVTVSTDLRTGYRAVAWGFGLPLVVLVAVIVVLHALTGNDALAALVGLAALVPYYFVLYLLRNRIGRTVSFKVE
jgi:sigma-E factor negative regulatory protein RseC